MKREKYLYCYNIEQAKFFKRNGIHEFDIGFSPINKKIYFKFERGDELDRVFNLWIKKCKEFNNK